MTLDQIPYIGQYSGSLPGCYIATGFNKWGMTSSPCHGSRFDETGVVLDNPANRKGENL